ncbi:MAG: SPOR domain-containing protein [Balneolaceae bacterium]|nr:SPOR domain-containing protein [Balneolaceae bacterium]
MKYITLLLTLLLVQFGFGVHLSHAQDDIPVREYTNPDEMVTFDRNAAFSRALDVFNEFSQENLGKIIVDRSGVSGSIGISIPAMHWREALDLILSVKERRLVERPDFFEIVDPTVMDQPTATTGGGGPAGEPGEGPPATTETREIRINAIFFEGNRRALREIGVDWSTLYDVPATPDVRDFVNEQGNEQIPETAFTNQFVAVNTKGASNVSQTVFNALVNLGEIGESGIEVQALLSAFEADNLGEILASPTVKVMDGQQGRIQVGQDFSIKQRDFAGNVIDEFFSVGTILEVTPRVIQQEDTTFIHLEIKAERSSAQPDPVSTIVNKQTAETQSLLVDGESTAIAGLYRTEQAEVRRGVPILKDLPAWFFGLKYLFGFNSTDYQMRELVILIQAEMIPSIQERYDKKLKSKFQVLREHREDVRAEIKEHQRLSNPEENYMNELGIDAPEEEVARPDTAQTEEPATEMDESQDETSGAGQTDDQSVQNDEDQQIMDPEMKSGPVVLNLGMGEPETDKDEEQQPDKPADKTKKSEASPDEEQTVQQDTTKAAVSDEVSENEKESSDTEETTMDASSFRYYVIGASFKVKENADGFKNQLDDEGFEPLILTKTDSDFYMVAYRGYNTLSDAKAGLNDIREYYNENAWLYVK